MPFILTRYLVYCFPFLNTIKVNDSPALFNTRIIPKLAPCKNHRRNDLNSFSSKFQAHRFRLSQLIHLHLSM